MKLETLGKIFSEGSPRRIALSVALLVLGIVVIRFLTRALAQLTSVRLGEARAQLNARVVRYVLTVAAVVVFFYSVGVDLKVLAGAAGVLTVALGIAAQASASNLISGIFLLLEGPFKLGDLIIVNGIKGEVVSVELLSVKLLTLDNLYVRIPSETLIKNPITNLTHFPIRRLDMELQIACTQSIAPVRSCLESLAQENALCLDEPGPLFIVLGLSDGAILLQFSVWGATSNYIELSNAMYTAVAGAVLEGKITIHYPTRALFDARTVDVPRVLQSAMTEALQQAKLEKSAALAEEDV